MKSLANYITLSRIFLSVLLLFTQPLSVNFFVIFIICAISDGIDGYIAKNMGLSSDFGAKLDSIADIVFFLSFIWVLLPVLRFNMLIISWILIIFLIRMLSIIAGYVKFNRIALIHTYLNKLTGACLILIPFLLLLISSEVILIMLCFIATLASVEEIIIVLRSRKLDLNCKSIIDCEMKVTDTYI